MAGTLWIDIEDLFHYTLVHTRPTGIQRVGYEICQTLHARRGATGTVRFVRYDAVRDSFRPVEWTAIAAAFAAPAEPVSPKPKRLPDDVAVPSAARRLVRKWAYRLPGSLRVPATDALVAQDHSLRAWGRLLGTLAQNVIHAPRQLVRSLERATRPALASDASWTNFAAEVAPGDTLLTLGAFWSHPDYAALIEQHRTRLGLRYALVVYDIIPLRRPEWCERSVVRAFSSFFVRILPLCDAVLTISHATAADVAAFARERGMTMPGAIVPIPMGSGFGVAPPLTAVPRTTRLPPAGGYVLFVSTIEVRKNHALMFRVWRRLLEELPPEDVPILVFAGRVGWLVDDLMRQIANADYLDGKLMIVRNPDDSELAALYQGCRFTVFPSLYEGWGLPVTESLAFGKPCLIADRTSLPEAGGDFVRRFDPDNLNDAFAAILNVIANPADLARWEAHVRRDFRPVPWTASADALLAALGFAETPATDNVPEMVLIASGALND